MEMPPPDKVSHLPQPKGTECCSGQPANETERNRTKTLGHFIKYTEDDRPKKPMIRKELVMGAAISLALGAAETESLAAQYLLLGLRVRAKPVLFCHPSGLRTKSRGFRIRTRSGQEFVCRAASTTYDPDKLHALSGYDQSKI